MHATIMYFAIRLPDWSLLDSVRRAHSFLEGAALVFFALLVVCEALAHLSDDKKTERRFDKIGIVFFALAVLAEIAAYPYGQRNDKLSADMIGSLSEKATAAGAKADAASDKSDAVGKKADAIQERLDGASKQLTAIEERVRIQGPRWVILAENKDKFIRDLKPFNNTRVTVLICGAPGSVSPFEQFATEQRLLEFLGKTGANWETGYQSFKACAGSSMNGLQVSVSISADKDVKEAAKALQEDLAAIDIPTSLDVVPLDRARFFGQALGADPPEARTLQEPNTVFVLVAPSNMLPSIKPKKHKAKTPP